MDKNLKLKVINLLVSNLTRKEIEEIHEYWDGSTIWDLSKEALSAKEKSGRN